MSVNKKTFSENDSNKLSGKPSKPILRQLGYFAFQKRWVILAVSLILLISSGVVAAGTVNKLSLSRFEVPGSQSIRVHNILHQEFNSGSYNLILLVTAKNGNVDSPEVFKAGLALMKELSAEKVVNEAGSYWSRGFSPVLRSNDRTKALIVARMYGSATQVRGALADISPRYTRENDVIKVEVSGQDEIFRQASEHARKDFVRAELIILPTVLFLLILIYRRFRIAVLTVVMGIFSMLGTLAALGGVVLFTEVSTFALNLTLILGLGLGIDYCLFIVARFREELGRGRNIREAVGRSVEAAGRSVIFSGVTVAVSMTALLIFPFPFLRSFAYAGVLVVLISILLSIIVLPAALSVLGNRAARRVPQNYTITSDSDVQNQGLWYRTVMGVMRRPILFGGAALVLLLVLGSPFLRVNFGLPDDRILPPETSSRQVQEQIRIGFPGEETDSIHIVAEDIGDPEKRSKDIEQYASELSRVPGIFQVDSLVGSFANGQKIQPPNADSKRFANTTGTWFSAIPSEESLNGDVPSLVRVIRSVPSPFEILVGGYPADLTDYRDAMLSHIPIAAILIIIVTFVILFQMSGSLVIPLKATLLNTLSLSVMFGSVVWIFQEGNLSNLFRFTPTGSIEPSFPILMFCIAYGLSMDYEVFIMSRIKEEYERTGNNMQSVATGIQRSAPLITAAAAIMAFTFATYATGGVVFLKMIGVGMALAVIVDALLIRTVAVPAFMQLAGKANWWAPPVLKRLYKRFGISEVESD